MLRVGLTGGIGSGKSTVGAALGDLGAVVVDADRVAREVVEPGTEVLAAVRERFGSEIIAPQGGLDRPALARIVFEDSDALHDLEAITHPAIWRRTAELVEEALHHDPQAVVVHDMPLLVEKGMTGQYHLVVVVETDEETRVRRLVAARGLAEQDARARVRAQATDAERRAAADVLLDNNGTAARTRARVGELWRERIAPFEENLRVGRPARVERPVPVPADAGWPAAADRLIARIRTAGGHLVHTADHVGLTAVPGVAAPDIVELQVGVRSPAEADDPVFLRAMAQAGFPREDRAGQDVVSGAQDGDAPTHRVHRSCDPGRPATAQVTVAGSPGWRWALLLRDWLRADGQAAAEYAALQAGAQGWHEKVRSGAERQTSPVIAIERQAEVWARRTGWRPPPIPRM